MAQYSSINKSAAIKINSDQAQGCLNQDTLSVIEVLHDAWGPMVSGAEMVEKPNV